LINGGYEVLCWGAPAMWELQTIQEKYTSIDARTIRLAWIVQGMEVDATIPMVARYLF